MISHAACLARGGWAGREVPFSILYLETPPPRYSCLAPDDGGVRWREKFFGSVMGIVGRRENPQVPAPAKLARVLASAKFHAVPSNPISSFFRPEVLTPAEPSTSSKRPETPAARSIPAR